MPKAAPRVFATPQRVLPGLLAVPLCLLSCQEFSTGPTAGIPASLVQVEGDGQSATAYGSLPDALVVRVEDGVGDPVPGIGVTWTLAGEGSLSIETDETDEAGEARAAWTLSGMPGTQTATAAASGLDSVTFSATATPASPAEAILLSGDQQEGEVGTALAVSVGVRVLDAEGRPVLEAPVEWVTEDGGSFDPAAPATDADGEAEVVWTLGTTAGDQTATATIGSLDPLVVTAAAAPGPFDALTPLAPEIQWAPLPDLLQAVVTPGVRLEDRYGNPLAGELVRFIAGDESTVTTEIIETDADGTAVAENWSFPAEVGGYELSTTVTADELEGPRFGLNVYEPLLLDRVWGGTRRGHTCGLNGSGTAFCWGAHTWGFFAQEVEAGDAPFTELAMGATDYGLTAAGALYSLGAVGSGFGTRLEDAPVPFDRIAAGQFFYCGLSSAGEAYCWGSNDSGAAGRDTLLVSDVDVADAEPVAGAPPLAAIVAGWRHACGLTSGGEAYCWGLNDHGQLGDGTESNSHIAQAVTGGRTFVALSLGHRYSCGLEADGAVYCWGRDYEEDGSSLNRSSPTRVAEGFQFVEIAAGEYHICGLQDDGQVLCWRRDEEGDGVFGDGTASQPGLVRRTPAPIAWDAPLTSVTSNQWASCATSAEGVICWGAWDLLGFPHNTHAESNLPVYVTAPGGT